MTSTDPPRRCVVCGELASFPHTCWGREGRARLGADHETSKTLSLAFVALFCFWLVWQLTTDFGNLPMSTERLRDPLCVLQGTGCAK